MSGRTHSAHQVCALALQTLIESRSHCRCNVNGLQRRLRAHVVNGRTHGVRVATGDLDDDVGCLHGDVLRALVRLRRMRK